MFRRHQLAVRNSPPLRFISVAFVAGLVAVSANGCSDPAKATPRVAFDSQVQPGTHKSTECGQTGPWFSIGSFGNPALGRVNDADPTSPLKDPVVPIDDGAADQQGTVAVSCSVTPDGDGFRVAAHAELTGATGGAVTLQGHFNKAGDQPGIVVALTRRGETFTDNNCVARFDTVLGHAVAAGRVWALVDCPNAENSGAQQTCASHAQFRFENCTQ
jgi:hypothetical protein